MTCASIMTSNPVIVMQDDSIAQAIATLATHRLLDVPVVSREGEFVGMFGLRDAVAMLVPRVALAGDLTVNLRFLPGSVEQLHNSLAAWRDEPVHRAMEREAISLYPDTPVAEAIKLVCRDHVSVPVVERNSRRLAGVIGHSEILRALAG